MFIYTHSINHGKQSHKKNSVYRVLVGSTSTVKRNVWVAHHHIRKIMAMWISDLVDDCHVCLFAIDTMVPVRFTSCHWKSIFEIHFGARWQQRAHTPHFQETLCENTVFSLWNHIRGNSKLQMPLRACDVHGLYICVQTAFGVHVSVGRTSHRARLDRCRDVDNT